VLRAEPPTAHSTWQDVRVKKKPRAGSPRNQRRQQERSAERLLADRERLFELEPGGQPAAAIEVATPSVIDSRVAVRECPRCAGVLLLLEQAAVSVDGVRLREARLRCRECGSRRSLWFRLVSANPN
jgi:hypothetical protein